MADPSCPPTPPREDGSTLHTPLRLAKEMLCQGLGSSPGSCQQAWDVRAPVSHTRGFGAFQQAAPPWSREEHLEGAQAATCTMAISLVISP